MYVSCSLLLGDLHLWLICVLMSKLKYRCYLDCHILTVLAHSYYTAGTRGYLTFAPWHHRQYTFWWSLRSNAPLLKRIIDLIRSGSTRSFQIPCSCQLDDGTMDCSWTHYSLYTFLNILYFGYCSCRYRGLERSGRGQTHACIVMGKVLVPCPGANTIVTGDTRSPGIMLL